jgi:hypothetical protein
LVSTSGQLSLAMALNSSSHAERFAAETLVIPIMLAAS